MYHSRKGNTKKIAEAIAQSVNERAEAIPPAYPCENVGLLFLGAGIYGGKMDKKMEDFIKTLNSSRVKNAVVFGTSGGQDAVIKRMQTLLREQGVNVLDETFMCKGKFFLFFNRSHPNSEDLNNAVEFAKKAVEKVKE